MLPKKLRDIGFKESDFEYYYTDGFYKFKPKPKPNPLTTQQCYILSLQHQPLECHLIHNGFKPCKECFRSINLLETLPKTNNNTLNNLTKLYSII